MTQPFLLSTKLFAPLAVEGLVSRPRLLQMLQPGLQANRKWTLVSAPAGYGKSTLIAEWLQQAADPFAWVSLDKKDNDSIRFLTYAIAALQKIKPNIGQSALTLLDSFQQPDPETLLTTLINEISGIAHHLVLVLDDYHQIEADEVHGLMRFLLDHQPENLHLVLITRQDPPFPISRFRASSQVIEIRASHLRFTPVEVKQFFDCHGLKLQAGWIQTLEDRTEGWAVGLSLAALSMQGHENLETFFQSFSGTHRYILDYLFDEVMLQQPELLRDFLSQTAILERFCAHLCDSVLNQSNSQSYLAQIERANLFLIPLDNQRIWYRYHHLFADTLRASFEQAQPERVSEIHHRAAAWFENKNLPDEAIQHALAVPDLHLTAHLIEKYCQLIIFERNEPALFNTWFANLPPEVVNQHPALLPAKAWSEIILSNLKSGEYWFKQAIQATLSEGLTDESRRSILGQAYTAGATLGMLTGNKAMLSEYAPQALELLPPKSLFMRCIAQWCLGQDYRYQVQIAKAEQAFAESAQLSQAAGSRFFYLLSLSNQGDRLFELGKLHAAARVYQEIQQSARQSGRTLHPMAGESFLHHSELLLEWNQLDAAYNLVLEGFQLARQSGIKEIILNGYEFLARIQMAQQNLTGAMSTIKEGIEYADQYQVHLRLTQMKAWQAQLWILATNGGKSHDYLPPASVWAGEARAILDQPLDALQFITYLTLANVDIAEERYPECAEILDRLQQTAERMALGYLWIKVQVLRACLYEHQGERKKALESLNQALAEAKPEGCIRVFLDSGPILETLLKQFCKEPAAAPLQDYLQTLLSGFKNESYEPAQLTEKTEPLNPPANRLLIEPLNERELEILRLIAQGLTNREIADHLSLSPKTIKWHAYNLYAKLGVNSRTQALACAREQSLI